MPHESSPAPPADLLAARELVLRALALASSDPSSGRFQRLLDPGFAELACAAATRLAEDPATAPDSLAPGEIAPSELDLTALFAALDVPHARLLQDHTRVFGLVVSKECPPYEVQYCPQTFSIHRSQRMADIAGFYRAFGVTPGRDVPERVDHLACELEFEAWLVSKERYASAQTGEAWEERARLCRDAQREFLAEHLAWWMPAFARALDLRSRSLDPVPGLALTLARALSALVPCERALLGVEPPDLLARPSPDEEAIADACASCGAAQGA